MPKNFPGTDLESQGVSSSGRFLDDNQSRLILVFPTPTGLHVGIFRGFLCYSRVYSIDSLKLMGQFLKLGWFISELYYTNYDVYRHMVFNVTRVAFQHLL
jgi:hypothetical protein